MKVYNEKVHALEQGDAHRKPKVDGEAFGNFLTENLQDASKTDVSKHGNTTALDNNATASLALLMQGADKTSANVKTELAQEDEKALEDVDNLLARWDGYVEGLKNPDGGNLRSMYTLLQSMQGEVAELKSSLKNSNNQGLTELVNEMDVLTTTETFKFNRGDYL